MRQWLLLLCTLVSTAIASRAGIRFVEQHTRWLRAIDEHIARLNGTSSVAVLDVGANSGAWSAGFILKRFAASTRCGPPQGESSTNRPALKLYLFEPQPIFAKKLQAIADKCRGGELVRAAAWTSDTHLTFSVESEGSVAATAMTHAAPRGARARNSTVAAIDFERFLRERVTSELVVFKLDVEGAEYLLLPRLLLGGSLCRVDYLLIEWHLSSVPDDERLAALSLRHSFDTLLRRGCVRPPRRVIHDDVWNNGVAGGKGKPVAVPGLMALAQQHSGAG